MRKFTSRLVAGIATMGLLIAPALPASASSEVINKRTLVNHAKTVGDAGTAYLAVDNGPEDDVVRVGETISFESRFQSGLSEIVYVKATSEALGDTQADKCSWRGVPYNSGAQLRQIPAKDGYWCVQKPSYKVKEADLEHPTKTFDITYNVYKDANASGKPFSTLTVKKTVKIQKAIENPGEKDGPKDVLLAKANDFDFPVHRIPALAKAPNGNLLAAWDGRPAVYSNNDSPNPNTILLRISKDNGETWEPVQKIASGQLRDKASGKKQIGYSDPSFVVDNVSGKVFAFFVKSYDQGIAGSRSGVDPEDPNVIHAVYVVSENNGESWSAPKDVTGILAEGYKQHARFATSGAGIQLKYGDHPGRLIQQYLVVNNGQDGNWGSGEHQAVSLYSDDNGKTWHSGKPVGTTMDENKVVELSDGKVLLSSRQFHHRGGRHYAISSDGGINYQMDYTNDNRLADPQNNASIIRAFPEAKKGSALAKVLLSSHANSRKHYDRVNGTISYSLDDGATWTNGSVFKPGKMQYSVMTALGNDAYGILYEGNDSTIVYKKVDLNWISPELAKYAEDHKADLGNADSEAAEKIKKLEDEIADLKAKLEAANQAKDEAEKAAKKAEEEKRDADREKVKAETAKREVEAKLKKAEGDKADLEKRVAELEGDIAKAEEAKKAADKAVEEANAAKKKAEEEAAELKAKNAELEKKLKEAGKAEIPLVPLTPAEPTPAPEPQPAPAISMVSDKVAVGSQVVFTGTGFTPDAKVKVAVHSTAVELGEYVADKDGKITVTWTVPAGFELGAHKVIFTAGDKTVEKSFTVVAPEKPVPTKPAAPGLAKTGVTLGLVAGLATLSIMAGVVAVRRRHEV
ncbi:hypothetical protein EBF03_06380 [Arcanobacterium haemolyticum]|uniref:exo-alpha-sialidase n=1 Tax=Arcanobacterium haemolyticum (strain ATCC 9345 / DSM 20595 / CCM 5947 / CCUG 17215 / LMG 16163 / NBRC 15585 / NCTC 8452 / 11018) TaxID=644284 RepID=D7BK24_ARCHD|nr:exo-alpha-sialidase [Arcanobacterium haemolyticum]ADH93004.1 LPXTG-motif cell wall anchor domain protein [Arcanobacterium haemolyticum DSM 20595]QCX47070.1 hypothetical protein EBF03_06380 [Arcanobacterium haemolyticum]SQH28241.1 Sialidase precursor [Arcanobacterium haemolyticum]